MFTVPIILVSLYIAYQIFMLIYSKYQKQQQLWNKYSAMVRNEDCTTCINQSSAYMCANCRHSKLDPRKYNYRSITFEEFKKFNVEEVTDGDSE